MNRRIRLPGNLVWGRGSITELVAAVEKEKPDSVLIFTDQGVRDAGLTRQAEAILTEQNISFEVIDGLPAEPAWQELDRVLNRIRKLSCGMIVAIGGGSVMDAAKLCAALLKETAGVMDAVKDNGIIRSRVPLVMIPTTCGTGSEATCNSIVAVPEENMKIGIVSEVLIPDYVILDSEMVDKLPPHIVASTGIDALAHAVECFTSKKATRLSDLYAGEGARILFHNLQDAYLHPERTEAREALQLGAYYGGAAITSSGTTAVHALSYPLGGRYHIPHGIANAILFTPVMRANKQSCQTQLASLCDICWPEHYGWEEGKKADWIVEQIGQLVRGLDIPEKLTRFGVTEEDLEDLTEAGCQVKRLLDNNRKVFTKEEIKSLYLSVLE